MIARVRGFTLIELLVALTLLSLGLLGAWSLLVSSLRGQVDARHHAAAIGLVLFARAATRGNGGPIDWGVFSQSREIGQLFQPEPVS